MTRNLKNELATKGFAIVEDVLSDSLVQKLIIAIERAFVQRGSGKAYSLRRLANVVPEVMDLAQSPVVRDLVGPVLGPNALVQSLFFDKTPDSNWNVAWHQDLMIPMESKVDDPQYGPWSLKDGVWHAQPPVAILEGMMTLRLHLDDCAEENGPLRVLPGSHTLGILKGEEIDGWRTRVGDITCSIKRGGTLLMRPLLLHASSRAKSPKHRRVIHLEFAAKPLPGSVRWLGR